MTNKAHDFYTPETITAMETSRQNAITVSYIAFDEAWETAYKLTPEEEAICKNRFTFDVAFRDGQESINYWIMSEEEAWDSYDAEEARKVH